MINIHPYALAFDTNIFKNITKKGHESRFERLFQDLNKMVNPKNEYTGFMSTITPFLLLEYLGQVPPNLSITGFSKEEVKKHRSQLPREVFHKVYPLYESDPSLSDDALRVKNEENKKYVSTVAASLYRDVVEVVTKNQGFAKWIRQNLAADFSYRYPYQKVLSGDDLTKIHIMSVFDIYAAHKERLNLTQMRGILKLCEDLKRRASTQNATPDANDVLNATIGIKEHRDLFDLDLIQLACLGAFVDKKKYPAIILTADAKDSIVPRIKLFKNTFYFFENQPDVIKRIETDKDTFEKVQVMEGKIGFVDSQTGSITEMLEVSSIEVEGL